MFRKGGRAIVDTRSPSSPFVASASKSLVLPIVHPIQQSLQAPDALVDMLCTAKDLMVNTRRLKSLSPPQVVTLGEEKAKGSVRDVSEVEGDGRVGALLRASSSVKRNVPPSPLFAHDQSTLFERGWVRSTMEGIDFDNSTYFSSPSPSFSKQDYWDLPSAERERLGRNRTRLLNSAAVQKVSDVQIHEVFEGEAVVFEGRAAEDEELLQKVVAFGASNTSPSDSRRGSFQPERHFHFILFRQRWPLASLIRFLSEAVGYKGEEEEGARYGHSAGKSNRSPTLRIPPEAFRVGVMPCDASFPITQRLSVSTSDVDGLRKLVRIANEWSARGISSNEARDNKKGEGDSEALTAPRRPPLLDDTRRYCRLQPVGFASKPCEMLGDDGPSSLQYTVLLRGVVGNGTSPRKTLRTANSALRDSFGVVNYVNPLIFGGTQPLLGLAVVHKLIRAGQLEEALPVVLALAGRSGEYGRLREKVLACLEADPLATHEAMRLAKEGCLALSRSGEAPPFVSQQRLATGEEDETKSFGNDTAWFAKGIELLHCPQETLSYGEMEEFFHQVLPLSIRRAIKFSTPLLAFNITSSVIASYYREYMRQKGMSIETDEEEVNSNSYLKLPLMEDGEAAVRLHKTSSGTSRMRTPSTSVHGEHVERQPQPIASLFSVPLLSLPWDRGLLVQSVSSDADVVGKAVVDSRMRPADRGVHPADLPRVVLPIGFHPFKGSIANVGLAAVQSLATDGDIDASAEENRKTRGRSTRDDIFGFRPLFVPPQRVSCYVCHRKTERDDCGVILRRSGASVSNTEEVEADSADVEGGAVSETARLLTDVELVAEKKYSFALKKLADLTQAGGKAKRHTHEEEGTRLGTLAARLVSTGSKSQQLAIYNRPSDASDSSAMPHSLLLRFQLPPSTDPSSVLMSFVRVAGSRVPFVPEGNGMHVPIRVTEAASSPPKPSVGGGKEDRSKEDTKQRNKLNHHYLASLPFEQLSGNQRRRLMYAKRKVN